jgi:phosphate transport system substrate-binding protein
MKGVVKIVGLVLLTAALGCRGGSKDQPKQLNGAGSTFVYPLMVQWAAEYESSTDGCKVNYRSLGSSSGVKFMTQKKGDFGCSDGPMSDEQLALARDVGGEVLHIPLVLGAVVPAYNLPEVTEPLRFTGPVLADVYLGKIKRWTDKPLRDLNPGAKLPDQAIDVVRRRDGSGTTYIWTDYLSKVSPEWKKKVGVGFEVKWPTGDNEVGNDGVAEHVKNTPGSIGYIELSYAMQKDVAFGLVQNRAKEFVKASLPGVRATAANALMDVPDDLRYSLTDAPGKGSYPICGTTWAILYANQPAGKGKQLEHFLRWAIGEGQERVERLFYARLPDSLLARASKKIDQIRERK